MLMGLHHAALSEYYRGYRTPNPATCQVIATFFGVDPNLVMVLAGHLPAEKLAVNSARRSVHDLVETAPEDKLPEVEALLKTLLANLHDR
jgi:hypothetical protein